jgi:hypothetical protein
VENPRLIAPGTKLAVPTHSGSTSSTDLTRA